MPAPKDKIKYKEYIRRLKVSHIGKIPWNKGLKGTKSNGANKSLFKNHFWNIATKEQKILRNRKVSESLKGKKKSNEHRLKIIEHLKKIRDKIPKGQNHYRWIKDRNILLMNKRNDPEYKQWVKKVKNRDGCKCRINNYDCSGYCIVHHILSWRDFPELRYNINNGITLCQFHHPLKRDDEQRLIPFFQGLVEAI